MSNKKSHLFGPILSRRLGMSLGVDLVPAKICNLDCVYCECGRTTEKTVQLDTYIDPDVIIQELDELFSGDDTPQIDIVTFTGSGEPTLNRGLGKIARFLREKYPELSLGVLTNSGMLKNSEIRKELQQFDYVLPSLDAMFEDSFIRINNPAKEHKCEDFIEGLRAFAKEYQGILWVELFILPGVNDTVEELTAFKTFFEKIQPTRIQINSMDRPGTCSWVEAPPMERLIEIEEFFKPLPVEIISRKAKEIDFAENSELNSDEIVDTIFRRPLTVEDLATTYKSSINELEAVMDRLIEAGRIEKNRTGGRFFYRVTEKEKKERGL